LKIKDILSIEKVAYSHLLKQEAEMIISLSNEPFKNGADLSPFEKETEPFFSPLTPIEWGVTDSELELLLKSMYSASASGINCIFTCRCDMM
jgi:hypothetical protein